MAIKPSSPRQALGQALMNDRGGVVSEADAKKLKEAVVDHVMTAADPAAAFDEGKQVVEAARVFVGADKDTGKVLDAAVSAGRSAISVRMGQLTGSAHLPQSLQDQLKDTLEGQLVLDDGDTMKLSQVQGDDTSGYSFHLKAGGVDADAFAIPYDGGFVIAPQKLTKAQLDAAVNAAQKAYDEVRENADPDGEYGFEDVGVEIRHADWDALPKTVLDFSHGAPEGGLFAELDDQGKWSAWETQM
jgi:hypothetical protein